MVTLSHCRNSLCVIEMLFKRNLHRVKEHKQDERLSILLTVGQAECLAMTREQVARANINLVSEEV